jgi:uncharacterized phage infection (PIP) family protein YhgE
MHNKLIALALASATFGGAIGALATAAVQSQASPEAIAAAVQRVSDSNAEQSLRSIDAKLTTLDTDLNPNSGEIYQLAYGLGTQFQKLESGQQMVNSSVGTLAQHLEYPGEFGGALNANAENLWAICQDTPGNNLFRCQEP